MRGSRACFWPDLILEGEPADDGVAAGEVQHRRAPGRSRTLFNKVVAHGDVTFQETEPSDSPHPCPSRARHATHNRAPEHDPHLRLRSPHPRLGATTTSGEPVFSSLGLDSNYPVTSRSRGLTGLRSECPPAATATRWSSTSVAANEPASSGVRAIVLSSVQQGQQGARGPGLSRSPIVSARS